MKLTYRIFGIRHNTGHTDWNILRQGLLAILFASLFFAALDTAIDMVRINDELVAVRAKLELREYQIVRCLNGQSVGYVSTKDRTVYTICNPATEIDIRM